MVVQLNSCCCGCSLRTGTIIIAVFGVLGGLSLLLQGVADAGDAGEGMKKNGTIIGTARNSTAVTDDEAPGEDGFSISQAIYGFLQLIINILLLVGAIRNTAKLIFPWIFVNVILCIMGLITFLGMGIVVCLHGTMTEGISYFVGAFIITALNVYFILVVNSFHTTLKSGPISRA